MAQYINQVGYGLSSALPLLAPYPIQANRIPTTHDIGYPLGQIWVAKNVPSVYILTQIAAGVATWQLVAPSGGGSFTTITSTGQFNLDTTAVGANTLGNTNGATSLAISVGTGGYTLDGVPSSTYSMGLSTTTGTITIGGTSESGTITLGSSTATNTLVIAGGSGATALQLANVQTAGSVSVGAGMTTGTITVGGTGLQVGTISIAPGTGAQSLLLGTGGTGAKTITIGGTAANVITIGNTQTAGSIAMGTAMTTGTISIGGTGLQVGTISIAPGTGAQIVNIGTGGTGVKTINIGTGAIGNIITIGTVTGAASVDILSGTGGILLSAAAGDIQLSPATVSAAAYAATLNARVGQVTLTGQVLAAGSTQDLTITNSVITGSTQMVMISVDNLGSNDAQLQITRNLIATGGFVTTVKNVGAAALNGDIHVSFWVMN